MLPETDLLILGGGCAGLSLAMRLAKLSGGGPSTAVIEQRPHYHNDRTWCSWDDGSPGGRSLVRHRWEAVSVAGGERRVQVDCRSMPYQMVPADAFYEAATTAIAESSGIELSLGETLASEPRMEHGLWHLETSRGTRRARTVVDTRPARLPARGDAVLWQSFFGREIECEVACFNPLSADLMHFWPSHGGRILFLYLLPLSPHRALIEATVFAPEPLGPADLAPDLAAMIQRHVAGARHTVLRTEDGALPMGQKNSEPGDDPTWVKAGVAGGAGRAASGFAFQRIQRWADACAAAIAAGGPPLPHPPDPWLLRFMDGLFLRVLRNRPEIAPDLFLALFGMRDPRRIIRFMSDRATLRDFAEIAWALPSWPFLKELGKGLVPRRRR